MKITSTKRASDRWAAWTLLRFPLAAIIITLCFIPLFFVVASYRSVDQGPATDALQLYCSGGGPPQVITGTAAAAKILWNPDLLLSITLGFGHFTFAGAKALDFTWDLVVGSGGQALLIAAVYPLFRRLIIAHMEQRPISISTYTTVAFERISLSSIWAMLRDIWPSLDERLGSTSVFARLISPNDATASRFRARSTGYERNVGWDGLWLCYTYAFVYIMIFAKSLSLMTGYQAISTPLVRQPNSTEMVNASVVAWADLVVEDGSRIGLPNQYGLMDGMSFDYPVFNACESQPMASLCSLNTFN